MKKRILIIGLIATIFLLTGCEETSSNEIQQRQNVFDDGVTMTYTYTDIMGEEIVDELLSEIRMPNGSKNEAIFYKNKKLTYEDISNNDLLLLGAKNYLKKHNDATTMTTKEMEKEIHNIIVDEVKVKHKTVKDNCIDIELNEKTYNIKNECNEENGKYINTILSADDANSTAIEISEKVAYIKNDGEEVIIYREKDGKEIKRQSVKEPLDLKNISGLIIVKYTFIKYNDNYYFYSSELIG